MKKLFTLRHWLNAALHGRQLVQTGLLFISIWSASFTMEAQTETVTTITSGSNASVFGGPVTFTSTTKSNPFSYPSAPVPEGTVSFLEGAVVLAANVPVSATGTATFTTAALAMGSHAIAAVYNGTATYSGSTASIHQTVDGAGPCPGYASNTAYVNGAAAGANDGTTWANAFVTLQGALDAARTCGVTQIWVAQGTYQPTDYPFGATTPGLFTASDYSFHLVNGVAIYGGFSGNGSENNLAQRNAVLYPTILSGNNFYNQVVVSINDGPATRLEGFTITGGNNNGINRITVEGTALTLGAGLSGFNSSFNLKSVIITGNNAVSSVGGGIGMFNGSPTFTNVVFSSNTGGGMSFVSSGTGFVVTMTNCVFANNTSSVAGGLQLNGFNLTSNLTNVVFYNNTAPGGSGIGGGMVNSAGTTNLTNCSFINNTSTSSGGAMYNVNGATVNDKNGIYYNNNNGNTPYNGVFNYSNNVFNATTTFSGNPNLVNIADPDGPDNIWMTADDGLSIQSNSPAINAGTLAGAPATDIRGFSRSGNPDQGAYEYGVFATINTAGTLTPFTTCAGTASAEQTFKVSGVGLTANLDITAPAGFEVSLTSGSGFATNLSLAPSGGAVATTTIYVRLGASASGTPAGNITASSTSATTLNVAATGTVNISSAAPTGATGTNIICEGGSTTLSVAGGLKGTGATAEWFTGSCGGTPAGTGDNLTVSPTVTTTYYLRFNGTCNTTACATVTVTVNTLSAAPMGATGASIICDGASTTLSVSGGTKGTGAIAEWFTGSCAGTPAGTGDAITVSPTVTTTYYVRYKGDCNTTTCATVTVTVNTLSTAPTGATGTLIICNGASTTLSVAGGSKGIGAITEWFTGSCGGPSAGTGDAITVSPTATTNY